MLGFRQCMCWPWFGCRWVGSYERLLKIEGLISTGIDPIGKRQNKSFLSQEPSDRHTITHSTIFSRCCCLLPSSCTTAASQ